MNYYDKKWQMSFHKSKIKVMTQGISLKKTNIFHRNRKNENDDLQTYLGSGGYGLLPLKTESVSMGEHLDKICGTSIHKSMEICCRKLFEVTNWWKKTWKLNTSWSFKQLDIWNTTKFPVAHYLTWRVSTLNLNSKRALIDWILLTLNTAKTRL